MPFGGVPAAFQGVPSDEFPADIEETASTAHLYGKPFVAAEALTSSLPMYTATPWNLKWVADKYMAMGVNRHVLHTSPHQPGRGDKPGLTLGPFSQTFTRNETWADMAKPWITYLARSSFLLQQGRAVDDILYFYGEGAPSGVPYREKQSPAIPDGYATDYIDAEALLSLTSVKDGRIVTPSGASYAVLVLPDHLSRMTAPVARKLRDLVAAGATLVGPRPATSPSLTSTDGEVRAIVGDLWGATDGRLATHATYGKGNVYWGLPMASVLARQNVAPDAIFARETRPGAIVYTHRHLKDGDIFFVSNQTDAVQRVDAQFRVAGRAAELWRADTGEHSPASYRIDGQSTTVPLTLAPYDARFVVFRQPTSQRARSVAAVKETKVTTLDGPWDVHFPEGWGAPEAHRFETLSDWSKSDIPGIRYFSGTATYSRTVDVDAAMLHHRRLLLDLGEVHELARVRVNGKDVGIAWKPPYRVDVTEALHTGANRIEIEVANLWRNRLIGDAQPDAAKRYTFTSAPSGKGQGPFSRLGDPPRADSPLLPSGLIGPVTVIGAD